MQLLTLTAHLMDVLPFGGPHGPGDAAPGPNAAAILAAAFPWIVISLIHGVLVWITARKRRSNPWVWTILALVPVVDWLTTPLFFFLSLLSVLDRLHALEAARPAAAAPPPGAAQATWEA